MKTHLSGLLLLAAFAAGEVRSEIVPFTPVSHVSDPAGHIPASRAGVLDAKLGEFERKTGIRILIRLQQHSPGEAEDSVPGAYMRDLSAKLGLIETGVLAVHFADEDDWRVWIGNQLTAQFVGKPGTAQEHTESAAMHSAKEAWFELVYARADAAWKTAARDSPLPEERVRFAAEAIAEGLFEKLGPRAPAP